MASGRHDGLFRVLALDGGGAKGFYTLGVLEEIERMVDRPLHEHFDLIYGTSTGAIIASLLALGRSVDQILDIYNRHVPAIMGMGTSRGRTDALTRLAKDIFGNSAFDSFKTGIGIVATRWLSERPMIFKSGACQAVDADGFEAGFGVHIADAVRASCSAYPFFDRAFVTTASGDVVELIDGGYCANNPTLYAIADAVGALQRRPDQIRVVSIGVGVYPEPRRLTKWFARRLRSVQLLEKTLEINTNSMDQLREVLFKDIATVRISDIFIKRELAADLMEHDPYKLNLLRQQGKDSFRKHRTQVSAVLALSETAAPASVGHG